MTPNPVFHEWVLELPWKMQSVLMTATRGPDNFRYPNVKVVNRWIRKQLFHDADPSNPFIDLYGDPDITDDIFLDTIEHELEYVTVHYFGHLVHALEIIAFMHPYLTVRGPASVLYEELCSRILHLPGEVYEDFMRRLG